jgi:spermidine synthase
MIPWIQLDTGKIPGDGGELRLARRGAEFSIRLGTIELMNSRLSGSEEALATIVCGRLGPRSRPRILIGGLGMGFTLRAAQAVLPVGARIVVAELVPSVVAWARGPMAELFGDSLADPRLTIREADVLEVMQASPAAFDAILLDVDNGPEGLTRRSNDRIYDYPGLRTALGALAPGGILAVWSQGPDNAFAQRLRSCGSDVEEIFVRANKGRSGARHVIWLATRKPGKG